MAILLVICGHYFRFGDEFPGAATLNSLLRSGWVGVDLFFVLSGYLITRILLATREDPRYFRNFYARRALRIFPAYYLYLAVLFLVVVPAGGMNASVGGDWVAAFVFYVQNLAMVADGDWVSWRAAQHLWSLAIEEQFYWVWPLVVLAVPMRRLAAVCAGVILCAWAFKAIFVLRGDALSVYIHTLARMDALAIGAWIAVMRVAGTGPRAPRIAAIIAFVAAIGFAAVWVFRRNLLDGLGMALATTTVGLLFGAFLFLLTARQAPSWAAPLRHPGLVFFGTYSYGIYVLHLLGQQVVETIAAPWLAGISSGTLANLIGGSLSLLLTTSAAVLMYHFVEAPALRLKRLFAPAARRASIGLPVVLTQGRT